MSIDFRSDYLRHEGVMFGLRRRETPWSQEIFWSAGVTKRIHTNVKWFSIEVVESDFLPRSMSTTPTLIDVKRRRKPP